MTIARALCAAAAGSLALACSPLVRAPRAPVSRPTPSTPAPSVVTSTTVDCGLDGRFVHRTRRDGDRVVLHGPGALVFRSRYAVNTDGAPTSYHPDDPFGRDGLAINTICNGATAYTAQGEEVGFRQCGRLIELFRLARTAGWTKKGAPWMRFYGVATSDRQGRVPCVVRRGPYEGYFVSTTSLSTTSTSGPCDPSQYLDALTIPFIIVPRASPLAAAGMSVGDLAVIVAPETGRTVYAVVGDVGPASGLGEGSVAVAQALTGQPRPPRTRAELYGYLDAEVVTLVFTDERATDPFSAPKIEAEARRALAKFGGPARLSACDALVRE